MLILFPLAAMIAVAPVPVLYDVSATIAVNGRRVAAPRMRIAADTPGTVETESYRLTVTVSPTADGGTDVDSRIAFLWHGEWKTASGTATVTAPQTLHYMRTWRNDTGSVAVTIKALPAAEI